MQSDKELMQQALDALERVTKEMLACRDELAERGGRPTTNALHERLWDSTFDAYVEIAIPAAEALRARLAQPEQESAYGYASRLATAIWEKHYKDESPHWGVNDSLLGVLTQIDNMTTGLTKAQPEQEPVAWRVRCTDPLRDWTLMYRYPRTEDNFSNMEIQPLYTKPHSAAHSADSAESFCKPEPVTCSVRFPRHAPKHGGDWIIDPAFLLRVYHSIDPDAHYGFIPNMKEIETALLALEVIPSNLYTAPPQREWVGLTDEEIRNEANHHVFDESFFNGAIWARGQIMGKNNG